MMLLWFDSLQPLLEGELVTQVHISIHLPCYNLRQRKGVDCLRRAVCRNEPGYIQQ
jgi:hypothetical protein